MVTFLREDGSKVKVNSIPLTIMKRYRQLNSKDKEAGGVIIGRMIENTRDIIIDEITEPGVHDKRSKYSFFRSKIIQKVINIRWYSSRYTQNYLGEWHTHPESFPTPSSKDITNWKNVVRQSSYDQEYLLFIIVGQKEISIWELSKCDLIPIRLLQKDQI